MQPNKIEPATICLIVQPREMRAMNSPMPGANTSHHAQ